MFIAYLTQQGEGCDYTIGCGVRLVELDSETYDEALAELKKEYIYEDDQKLRSIILYEAVQRYRMPLSEWYAEKDRLEALEEELEQKQKERQEYERLRKLYGDR